MRLQLHLQHKHANKENSTEIFSKNDAAKNLKFVRRISASYQKAVIPIPPEETDL